MEISLFHYCAGIFDLAELLAIKFKKNLNIKSCHNSLMDFKSRPTLKPTLTFEPFRDVTDWWPDILLQKLMLLSIMGSRLYGKKSTLLRTALFPKPGCHPSIFWQILRWNIVLFFLASSFPKQICPVSFLRWTHRCWPICGERSLLFCRCSSGFFSSSPQFSPFGANGSHCD